MRRAPTLLHLGRLAPAAALLFTLACGSGPEGGGSSRARAALTAGSGTNAPGQDADFVVTVTDADPTLVLEVLADGATGSHLLVKHGAPLAPDGSDFDWASRRDGTRNFVALERPELLTGTYHVRVHTPAGAPGPHAFTLTATAGAPVRTPSFPASKPYVFATTGHLEPGETQRFRVLVPAAPQGARAVAACQPACQLGLSSGWDPGAGFLIATDRGDGVPLTVFAAPESLTPDSERLVDVSSATSTTYALDLQDVYARTLGWDDGSTPEGTTGAGAPDGVGGEYLFRLDPQAPVLGAWRHALRVDGGEANLVAANGSPPVNGQWAQWASERPGDDGFVLDETFANPTVPLYLVVRASRGATWRLVSGDVFAHDLGPLEPWYSSSSSSAGLAPERRVSPASAAVPVGPEGAVFFRTSIPGATEAWRLWAQGAVPDGVLVRRTKVPVPGGAADRRAAAQHLLVPPYLTSDTYFVAVPAPPRAEVTLDSRRQRIRTPSGEPGYLATGAEGEFAFQLDARDDAGFEFVTYRIPVPVQQIAWQVTARSTAGDADVYLRKGFVPNVGENDAMSEAGAGVTDSVTIVPPSLTDGAWYLTVHGRGAFQCRVTSGNPVVTGVPFINDPGPGADPDSSGSAIANSDPLMQVQAGWRYYQVSDIPSQLGSLGWELLLANAGPGAEIALRRNAVPGRWHARHGDDPGAWVGEYSHVDHTSTSGLLQRPGHQADIWYIGVYVRDAALGPFELVTRRLKGAPLAFNGAAVTVTGQPASAWRYFKVRVPQGALGWDLRLDGVTGGSPRFVIRRDTLPDAFVTDPVWYYDTPLPERAEWPTEWRWAPGCDWTGRCSDPDTTYTAGRRLVVGMGAPLQADTTYYVGVQGASPGGGPLGYTLRSTGIGIGADPDGAAWGIQVADLPLDGSASISNLPAREVAYYRVTVPAGVTGWQLTLTPAAPGEAMMVLNRGAIPNFSASQGSTDPGRSGVRRQKDGVEYFYRLPPADSSELTPGVYYVAVVSEGDAPSSGTVGAGLVSATLDSVGSVPVDDHTATPVAPGLPLTIAGASLPWGAERFHRLRVAAGNEALQLRTRTLAGAPAFILGVRPLDDGRYPAQYGAVYAAAEGGEWMVTQIPALNTWSSMGARDLTVVAFATTAEDVQYELEAEALGSSALAFNGGTITVAGQEPGTWRYFSVTVPDGELAWDLRLKDVVEGAPRLVVRRDQAPDSFGTSSYSYDLCSYLPFQTTWPSGWQWEGGVDWSGRSHDASGDVVPGRIIAPRGLPLEPGSYVVGVSGASSTGALSYTVESRGIGVGNDPGGSPWALQVVDLPFSGTASDTLPVREAAYYRATVPGGARSFAADVAPTAGEVMLASRTDFVPTTFNGCGVALRSKPGTEYLYNYGPWDGQALSTTTYYFAVVAEGDGPADPWHAGTGTSAFTLTARGEASIDDRTATPLADGAPVAWTAQALPYGSQARYRFRAPAGLHGLTVALSNVTGGPVTATVLRSAADAARIPWPYGASYPASEGGVWTSWWAETVLTLTAPEAGDYTVVVSGQGPQDATFDLTVSAFGPPPVTDVPFNDGTSLVAAQPGGSWRFFRVEVPAEALGWRVRLTGVTGDPQLVVRRDELPDSLSTTPYYWPNHLPNRADWPSGASWAAGSTWARRTDADGVDGREIVAGMGSPLEPGTYYVGVTGNAPSLSYTLESHGIGQGFDPRAAPSVAWTLQVVDLDYGGGIATGSLPPREVAFYRVVVPVAATSWHLELEDGGGGSALAVRQGRLPNSWAGVITSSTSDSGSWFEGALRNQNGTDYFYKFPEPGQAEIAAGEWFVAVVSQGAPLTDTSHVGTGPASYTLTSNGPATVDDRTGQTLSAASPVAWRGQTKAPGQERLYRFRVQAGTPAVEVALTNRTGSYGMALRADAAGAGRVPSPYGGSPYTGEGGEYAAMYGNDVVTWQAPAPGDYTLRVTGWDSDAGQFDVVVTALEPARLTLDAADNRTPGDTNVVAAHLEANQVRFYAFDVPQPMTLSNGESIRAWRLDVGETNGNAHLRVRRGALPNDAAGTTEVGTLPDTTENVITTPYLEPGTWYVEVRAEGLTDFTLTSSVVRPERPAVTETAPLTWQMPTTPNTVFGDSGIRPDGSVIVNPNTGDAGVDLARGESHFYRITVPPGNGGLLRTMVEALSGTPELYLRAGAVPSLSHPIPPLYTSYPPPSFDRWQRSTGTMYGNWVPAGRWDTELAPGEHWIMVHAGGTSNVRYRLRVSTGDVQPLALDGGELANQALAAGDMRYYRVQIPLAAPQWSVTFRQQLGDAVLYLREDVPPGAGGDAASILSWEGETNLNGLPYPHFYDAPGTYTFGVPPVVPGSTYYLGVYARTDSVFDVASGIAAPVVSAPAIAFDGGSVSTTLAAGATAYYRVDVPAGAARWLHTAVHDAAIVYRLGDDYVPSAGWAAWQSSGADQGLDVRLAWYGWRAGIPYYVTVTNTGPGALPYTFAMRASDADGDGWAHPDWGGSDCDDARADVHPNAALLCAEWVDGDCNGSYDAAELACCPDADADGHKAASCGGDDCDDTRADVHPGAALLCAEWVDGNCNGSYDIAELACCPDADADGHRAASCGGDDCDDSDPDVHPGAAERCNMRDDSCDGSLGAGEVDADGDGHAACAGDCNDADPTVHPGATDVRGNGVDEDCSGADASPLCPDADGDGFPAAWCGGTDCNDGDATIHPGAPEVAGDGADQDCDGRDLAPGCVDADGDGYAAVACGGTDCDDSNPNVHPLAREVAGNGTDDDCVDGDLVSSCADADGDGYADAACGGRDCDDGDRAIHPQAPERCGDGIDQDCSGADIACTCPDADGDGYAAAACGGTDCNDGDPAVHPDAHEVCGDTIDQDCSGRDLACPCPDADGDGYADAACGGTDCDDHDATIHPGAAETCGGAVDRDCSGAVLACTCPDADGDGYADARCGGGDCDDRDATIHPGAAETCGSAVDRDCDRVTAQCGCPDADGDGYLAAWCGGSDCNDGNATIHPNAPEIPGDGIDQDCSNGDLAVACADADGDGYADAACGGPDCNDRDRAVHPNALDVPGDGIDQDCSGADTPCPDADGDGYTAASCGGTDCNDASASIHPGATDTPADGIDQDCSGNDAACPDADGDGHTAASCGGTDCNDANASIHPGATDTPGDGIDQDCSGADTPCPDADRDGHAAASCGGTDCNDGNASIHPGATDTPGDGIDQDCSGADAPCPDADHDGHTAAACGGTDCNDAEPGIHRGAVEQCHDGIDNDCDGAIDGADPQCAATVTPPAPGGGGGGGGGRGGCGAGSAGVASLGLLGAWLLHRRRAASRGRRPA